MRPCALVLVLLACRRAPPPRRAPTTPPAPARSAGPASPPPAAPRAVDVTVDERAPWRPLAQGVRWTKLSLTLTPAASGVHPEARPMPLVWVVVRVEVARAAVTVERAPEDSLGATMALARDAVAVFDAGFFEPDHRPSGLVLSRGVRVAPLGPRGGSGVLSLRRGRAEVVPVDARDGGRFDEVDVDTAVQCGPRVVERGAVPGVYRHDGRFAARTVACVRDGGATLDLVATWSRDDALRGPELYDLATLLAGPSPTGDARGCDEALNLDGGPSTGVFVRDAAGDGRVAFRHEAVGPTPWALVLRPNAR